VNDQAAALNLAFNPWICQSNLTKCPFISHYVTLCHILFAEFEREMLAVAANWGNSDLPKGGISCPASKTGSLMY